MLEIVTSTLQGAFLFAGNLPDEFSLESVAEKRILLSLQC